MLHLEGPDPALGQLMREDVVSVECFKEFIIFIVVVFLIIIIFIVVILIIIFLLFFMLL